MPGWLASDRFRDKLQEVIPLGGFGAFPSESHGRDQSGPKG
jgi:hypothetical protein